MRFVNEIFSHFRRPVGSLTGTAANPKGDAALLADIAAAEDVIDPATVPVVRLGPGGDYTRDIMPKDVLGAEAEAHRIRAERRSLLAYLKARGGDEVT